MASDDLLESIKGFDINQLNDFNTVGSWPIAIKFILWVLGFGLVLVLGYTLVITDKQKELEKVAKLEVELKKDFEQKAAEAALLNDYRQQKKEMEERFDNVLRQLPGDTEIPGLLEDINNVGQRNELDIVTLRLIPEKKHEYYIEQPIEIIVKGGYHDLGGFVSDISDLSRIVTLHDFSIKPTTAAGKTGEGELLTMTILAKTYKYRGGRG